MTSSEREENDLVWRRHNEYAIRWLQAEITKIDEKHIGMLSPPPEEVALRDRLIERLRSRRAERNIEATPETAKGQLDRMWGIVSGLDADMHQIRRRIEALEHRIAGWFAQDSVERTQRQEELDARFDRLEQMIERNARERQHEMQRLYVIVIGALILIVVLLLAVR